MTTYQAIITLCNPECIFLLFSSVAPVVPTMKYSRDLEELTASNDDPSEVTLRWRNKALHARWIIAAQTVVCTVLMLILILTFELKFNCPGNDLDDSTKEEKSTENESADILKFFVVSDFHLDPFYKDNVSATDFCRSKVNGTAADYKAPYGRVGCDIPKLLLDTVLKGMKDVDSEENASFILLTGTLRISWTTFVCG